ncbi:MULTISPECIES: glutamine synthetase family protein [unclassified Streptomyces]|uniref:glutamine synthetase family protein n=1 Tax=unclassified Streptomyces TaxID=2593676 RepID=UPI0022511A31|nr:MULTISPECIES: glutamine synthetase family protein [unclassified Streptomyces]MCX4884248.1 glutamine synthetase family protein [Streptomyces sp. NBC_00847]MCX5051693.1 glutamine synthetase family protein [Streptomyces sp. NBC_00474]MCX5249584.1 glutamine synthetase family protein [Streptomyces sp. NBC_00201]
MSAHDTPSVRRHQDRLAAEGIDVVRVTYPDLIGTDRARDVLLDHLPSACEHGLAFCRAVYHTTPRGDVVAIEGGIEAGLPDISVRPDLSTLARVPWEPGVAWCLGDTTDPATGGPAAESPRDLLRSVLARCADAGLSPVVGPELEYFLLEEDATAPNGWRRSPAVTGSVYTAGLRADPDNHLLRTLRQLRDLGIGVITGNHEFDGGQYEINLTHSDALDAADRAFRFKAAVKELARKEGKLATFMAKPFNDSGGSGFHLHFSCVDADGRNVFDDPAGAFGLSGNARHAIAGLLTHAPALAALLNPTVNSYKRFGPDTLAPWLINWGLDNRSAMVRIPPERGSGARLEVRLGDAGANPYLAIAALTAAALLGVQEGKEPPAPLEGYGYDLEKSQVLPMNLTAALDALEADEALIELLGKDFTASFLAYKRDEAERFQRHVTDWEFAEYSYHL